MKVRDRQIILKILSEIDIAAHKYQTLKMEDVYQTIQLDFPPLKMQLLQILEMEEDL